MASGKALHQRDAGDNGVETTPAFLICFTLKHLHRDGVENNSLWPPVEQWLSSHGSPLEATIKSQTMRKECMNQVISPQTSSVMGIKRWSIVVDGASTILIKSLDSAVYGITYQVILDKNVPTVSNQVFWFSKTIEGKVTRQIARTQSIQTKPRYGILFKRTGLVS